MDEALDFEAEVEWGRTVVFLIRAAVYEYHERSEGVRGHDSDRVLRWRARNGREIHEWVVCRADLIKKI